MTNPNPKVQALVDAVVKNYLATGKDVTVKEMAALMGWSESTIRKLIDSTAGCPWGLTTHTEGRTSYSRSYKMFESGAHNVRVYGPTREALRALLVGPTPDPKTAP